MQTENDAPRARALLAGAQKPSHAGLDLAYQEALSIVEDLECEPGCNKVARLTPKWAALLNLQPGCNLPQRMEALRQFHGGAQ